MTMTHPVTLRRNVRRVTSTDTFVGYAPSLEKAILPQVDDLAEAIVELASY